MNIQAYTKAIAPLFITPLFLVLDLIGFTPDMTLEETATIAVTSLIAAVFTYLAPKNKYQGMDVATFLQEASISIAAVAALVYVVMIFIKFIKEQSADHRVAMKEREQSLREVEKEIRNTLTEHIVQSNIALTENSKALERSAQVTERIMLQWK